MGELKMVAVAFMIV